MATVIEKPGSLSQVSLDDVERIDKTRPKKLFLESRLISSTFHYIIIIIIVLS